MSQPSLLHPMPMTPPQNRPPSTKSGKQALGKSLKHAFSRKRLGSLRMGSKNDSDLDLSSQRSGSIGPESFVSNSDSRFSEEAVLDSSEPRYVSPSPLPQSLHGLTSFLLVQSSTRSFTVKETHNRSSCTLSTPSQVSVSPSPRRYSYCHFLPTSWHIRNPPNPGTFARAIQEPKARLVPSNLE